jgi:hypothetical protein
MQERGEYKKKIDGREGSTKNIRQEDTSERAGHTGKNR